MSLLKIVGKLSSKRALMRSELDRPFTNAASAIWESAPNKYVSTLVCAAGKKRSYFQVFYSALLSVFYKLSFSVLQSTMLYGNCCKAFSIACIFSAAKHNAFSTMNYFLQWKFLSAVRCEWWLPNASCWEVLRGALIDCFPFVHCRISRHSCSAMFFR